MPTHPNCLSWPSVTYMILKQKRSFLYKLFHCHQNLQNISLSIHLQSLSSVSFWTPSSRPIIMSLPTPYSVRSFLTGQRSSNFITSTDQQLTLEEACKNLFVYLAREINWILVWEAARDKGPFLDQHHSVFLQDTDFATVWQETMLSV